MEPEKIKKILYQVLRKYLDLFVIIGAWTILGLIMTGQIYISNSQRHNPNLPGSILVCLTYSYLWVAFYPLIQYICRNNQLSAKNWFSNSVIHIAFGLGLSILILGLYDTAYWFIFQQSTIPYNIISILKSAVLYLDYGLISYGFNILIIYTFDYYRSFRDRERKSIQLESQLVQAQLLALKMQLQPHFLFNTLHAIGMLIRKKENETALKMLTNLGDLLRYTLTSMDSDIITLNQETEWLKLYLNIQAIRFGDRLKVEINIPPKLESSLIPNLILQPLVENSIRHGISKLSTAEKIEITAFSENQNLNIIINNEGPLLQNTDFSELKKRGIGLLNTESRLKMIYNESFKLEIRNNTDKGVSVLLSIPLRFNHLLNKNDEA